MTGNHLRSGNTTSCGCYTRERSSRRHLKDRTGLRFGRLVVLQREKAPTTKTTRWRVRCDCGSELVVFGTALDSGATTSCGCYSRECASKMMAARLGKLHPNWNPNLTQEDRDRHRLGTFTNLAWNVLARQVRRRDCATCLVCGKHGTHVHHLEPWALYPDLRYDPANLVTLCKECHDQFHRLYGNDVGLDEFEEYLEP